MIEATNAEVWRANFGIEVDDTNSDEAKLQNGIEAGWANDFFEATLW